MKTMLLAVALLGAVACGGTPDPLEGDWSFRIANDAAGHQLNDGHGALHIFGDGTGYSNADTSSLPAASQLFGAVTWTRNGTEVRLGFCSPSQVPIATPGTFATVTITAEGTLEGTFHDPFGGWNGVLFSAHRL